MVGFGAEKLMPLELRGCRSAQRNGYRDRNRGAGQAALKHALNREPTDICQPLSNPTAARGF